MNEWQTAGFCGFHTLLADGTDMCIRVEYGTAVPGKYLFYQDIEPADDWLDIAFGYGPPGCS